MKNRETLDALRARIEALEDGGGRGGAVLPLGVAPIDAALGGGFGFGRVHELSGPAADAFAVALLARGAFPLLWCRDLRRGDPVYPPGLASLGLDPARVTFAAAAKPAETLWVTEEALASGGVAAVVAELAAPVDLTASRRLQLAAEKGGALGLALVPSGVSGGMAGGASGGMVGGATGGTVGGATGLSPNALSTRWRVTPREGRGTVLPLARWRLALLRRKGRGVGGGQGRWSVDWHGPANGFSLVSDVADGSPAAVAPAGRRAG